MPFKKNLSFIGPEIRYPLLNIVLGLSIGFVCPANAEQSNYTTEDVVFSKQSLPFPSDTLLGAYMADLDGDGDTDAIVTAGTNVDQSARGGQEGVILRNNGDNTFTKFDGDAGFTEGAREVQVKDFNGDSILDIFISDQGHDADPFPGLRDTLLLGTGSGFTNVSDRLPNIDAFSHNSASADVDSDGDIDIFVANTDLGDINEVSYLLINDGNANFTLDRDKLPRSLVVFNQFSLVQDTFAAELSDLDGDGFPDLVLGRRTLSLDNPEQTRFASRIHWNDGQGNFTDENVTLLVDEVIFGTENDTEVNETLTNDVDNDGDLDLFITSVSRALSGRSVRLLINKGNRVFDDQTTTRLGDAARNTATDAHSPFTLSFYDVNKDGIGDIVNTGFGDERDDSPVLWEGLGGGCYRPVTFAQIANSSNASIRFIVGTGGRVSVSPTGTEFIEFGSLLQNGNRILFLNTVPLSFSADSSGTSVTNLCQTDNDNDGIPDIEDTDDDNDSVADSQDQFPFDAAESLDTDGDGEGNSADVDDDNDGVLDISDEFPLHSGESVDTDGDGVGNNTDGDDDGDGVLDTADAFPLDSSETTDTDGDGVGDNSDSAVPMRLAAGQVIELSVTDRALSSPSGGNLIVPSNAVAVAVNVTVVKPVGGGHITVWPCGVPMPSTSNVNYVAGQVVANGVIAPVGSNGKVCFAAFRDTDLIVDIAGWFAGEGFIGATPKRLVDSRFGTGTSSIARISPDSPLRVKVTDVVLETALGVSTQVPSSIVAAALNITAVKPVGSGHITVYPCDVAQPEASNLNYVAGQVVANGVIAPVSADGEVCIFVFRETDVIVDLAGWFTSGFTGSTPKRLVDTRIGTGGRTGDLLPAEVISVPVRGVSLSVGGSSQTVPSTATAAALNITVVRPTGNGHVTVWPCGVDMPNASNLNYLAGDIVANNVIAPIGDDGTVCLSSFAGSDVIVDISGWFENSSSNGLVGSTPKRLVDTRFATGPAPQ